MFSFEFQELINELIPIGKRSYSNDVRKFIFAKTKKRN